MLHLASNYLHPSYQEAMQDSSHQGVQGGVHASQGEQAAAGVCHETKAGVSGGGVSGVISTMWSGACCQKTYHHLL